MGAPPERIFMIRHGQSAANADTSIYNRVPDYRIPLTERGVEEARIAGEDLRRKLDGEQVCVYVSPLLARVPDPRSHEPRSPDRAGD